MQSLSIISVLIALFLNLVKAAEYNSYDFLNYGANWGGDCAPSKNKPL